MDSVPDCHNIVASVVSDAVVESINVSVLTILLSAYWLFTIILQERKDVDELVSKGNKSVGKIFDKIIDRFYHREHRQITFRDLLSWDTWQTFLKIYGKLLLNQIFELFYQIIAGDSTYHSKFKLSENFLALCSSAKSALKHVCDLIEDGGITLQQLSLLKEKYSLVNDLFEAAFTPSKLKEIRQKLAQRFEEQALFAQWLQRLKQICRNVTIPITGKF